MLTNLLTSNESFIVAYSDEKEYSSKDFRADCLKLIDKIRQSEQNEFILSSKNTYSFAVALIALAHENKTICLPPGIESGPIEELKGKRGIISDFYPTAIQPIQAEDSNIEIELQELPNAKVILYTSGSTGERKEIQKNISHFNEEIEVLSQTWTLEQKAIAVSSVSHHHIYGLLFKVLWPLSTNRAFLIEDCLFENELDKAFQKYPDGILVSCPAHLDAMVNFPEKSFLSSRTIFSSGAPLSLETSESLKRLSKNAPIEVFGSTETGGIAWRQQTENSNWTLLDKVKIKTDANSTLIIHSPFCERQNEWYETGDKAELINESEFKHLGRKDRIVKVSGKRLSLDQLESKIENSSFVQSARIITVQEGGHTDRESVAAIIILSDPGRKKLEADGKRTLSLALKNELKEFFAPVLLPRFWRFIDEFPKNSQGKTENRLLSLFLQGFNEKEKRFPELKSLQKISDEWRIDLCVPPNCSFFEGHFNESPILPGVAQLFWVQFYTEKLIDKKVVKGINKLKFHQIIQPGDRCTLSLIDKENAVSFSFSKNEEVCSSGILKYE